MPVAPALVLFKDAYLSTVAGFGSALTSSPIGVMGNKSVFDAHLLAMDTGSILDIFVDASASGEEWIQIQASEAKSLADPVNFTSNNSNGYIRVRLGLRGTNVAVRLGGIAVGFTEQ